MTARRVAADEGAAAKMPAKQGNSRAKKVTKSVAQGANSRVQPGKPAAQRWAPVSGALLKAELWRDTDPGGLKVLVEQACRVADRLESLDHVLRGGLDAIMALDVGRIIARETPEGERKAFYIELGLKVDGAVAEERQQAKLFGSLLADITRQRAKLPLDRGASDGVDDESDDDDDLRL